MLPAAFLILAAALAIFASVVGVVSVAVRSRVVPGPSLVARTVVVNTERPDSQSIRGVLVAAHADRWTLAEVFYLQAGKESSIAGLIHVPTSKIAFVQEIEPTL